MNRFKIKKPFPGYRTHTLKIVELYVPGFIEQKIWKGLYFEITVNRKAFRDNEGVAPAIRRVLMRRRQP